MSNCTYYIGDTRKVVDSLPAGSVDLVLTSPPFLALRSYLPADHPDKALEIGSEATPADFLDTLLDLTECWARVLAPHGSIVVELGDTYSGSWASESTPLDDRQNASGGQKISEKRRTTHAYRNKMRDNGLAMGWPLDKSLCGIPTLYAWSLAYGRNLLRPERAVDPWRVRNVVAWCRPNPPVGALGDKFRPGTSYLTVATKARDRYFDLDAVREPHKGDHKDGESIGNKKGGENGYSGFGRDVTVRVNHPAGAPPLDWWEIPTEPYAGSHYATWPRKLLTRPILAMCPERVCTSCGAPSRRIVGEAEYVRDGQAVPDLTPWPWDGGGAGVGKRGSRKSNDNGVTRVAPTLGWSDCGHNAWRNGVVLDPFGGSGTTGAVATGHGRDAILVDLDERNADLARERIGMFLTVEDARERA